MLEPGTRYRVRFVDCCVEGGFEATLTEVVPDYPDDDTPELVFDNGVRIMGIAVKVEAAS